MAVWFRDTYTQASTTSLAAHTPDIGGAYTQRNVSSGGTSRPAQVTGGTGNLNIVSGEFLFTNAAAPAGTDYSVTDTWTPSAASFFARILTWISEGNFVQSVIDRYSGQIRFEEVTSWSAATLGDPYVVSMPNGSPVTTRVEVTQEGGSRRFKLFVGGVERINVTDPTPFAGIGLIGVRMDGGDASIGEAEDIGPTGPSFSAQPSNQTVTAPNTASFPWASNGTITGFQVQQRRGGGAWTNVPDGTGASGGAGTNVSGTYTTTATAVSTGNHRNGDEYRVVLNPSGTPVNSNAAALTVNAPTATALVVTVPDAAGLSGFNGVVLSASAPGSGVTVIATPTSITFNGSGQATINVTGLGIPIGARRWVSVTNATGDPAQSPAPVQAQGPVVAS